MRKANEALYWGYQSSYPIDKYYDMNGSALDGRLAIVIGCNCKELPLEFDEEP